MLVIGAALLIHSVRTLRSDPGFDVEHVAYFRMKPRLSGYDQEKASSYFRNLQRHLESLGEVESVAFVRFPPTLPPGAVPSCRSFYQAMPHQRRTKRSVSRSILSRLDFSRRWPYQSSGAGPSMTAILNRAGNLLSSIRSWLRGCGLIPIPSVRLCSSRDANSGALMRSPTKSLEWRSTRAFAPAAQHLGASLFRADWASATASGRMLVRVKGDARTMLPLLRQEIVAVDPNVAISEALSLSGLIENMYAEVPLAMRVVGYAGGLGLLLTAIGLYGVLALAVGQRTREIGVRMALGARVPSILSLILREGMALALAGLALGLASAIVLSRLLTRFLYGITPSDPVTYGVATVLVGGVALAACAIPAWRAARVDPMVALRYE